MSIGFKLYTSYIYNIILYHCIIPMSNLFVLTGRGSWTNWTIQAAANMDPVPFQVHHVTGAGAWSMDQVWMVTSDFFDCQISCFWIFVNVRSPHFCWWFKMFNANPVNLQFWDGWSRPFESVDRKGFDIESHCLTHWDISGPDHQKWATMIHVGHTKHVIDSWYFKDIHEDICLKCLNDFWWFFNHT
jgi:hypothetical protein